MGSSNVPARTGDAASPLAVTKDDLAALTDAQRQEIALRKNANIVTAQLAGTNWGKGLDDPTRRAVADWGKRNGIDVTTEIFVLGGNIYLNAQFYLNRLVGLLHRGLIRDYKQELIQHDERLDQIVGELIDPNWPADLKAIAEKDRAEAFAEIRRRRRLRIEHGAPEKSALQGNGPPQPFAIGLTTIWLAALPDTPIRGVKWAPHDAQDPVGKNYPQETALTRSARRALKQCVTHIPELARWVDGSEEDAAHSVSVALREHEQRRVTEDTTRTALPPGQPVAQADYLSSGAASSATRPHAEDVTQIRGPVAVQAAPGSRMPDDDAGRHPSDAAWVRGDPPGDRPSHEVAGDASDVASTHSLEDELGPLGAGGPDSDEIDDTPFMDEDERREWEARKRAGRS